MFTLYAVVVCALLAWGLVNINAPMEDDERKAVILIWPIFSFLWPFILAALVLFTIFKKKEK